MISEEDRKRYDEICERLARQPFGLARQLYFGLGAFLIDAFTPDPIAKSAALTALGEAVIYQPPLKAELQCGGSHPMLLREQINGRGPGRPATKRAEAMELLKDRSADSLRALTRKNIDAEFPQFHHSSVEAARDQLLKRYGGN
jgi:hypothetical protein